MTLTPSSIRLDLKCGKGAISKGEKCHKGVATKVAIGAAALGVAAGVGALLLSGKRRPRGRSSPSAPGQGMELLAEGTRGRVWLSADKKTVTKSAKNNRAAQELFEEARLQSKAHKAGVNTPKVISTDAKQKTIIMENLEGYKPVLTAAKNATPAQKEAYAVDLVTNLSKAHGADIAHGDLNTNVLAREEKLSIIDWGQASKVRYKGMADILNAIRIADDLNPALARTMKQEFKPLQTKFSKREPLTVADFNSFYSRVLKDRSRSDSARLDLKCGKGAISEGEKCTKGPATKVAIAAGIGLTAGALALGAAALSKRGRSGSTRPSGSTSSNPVGPSPTPRLPGSSPRALLQAAPPRQSKTQRMRANTAAAVKNAEGRIAQTAREEVRRIAQIGNTMAAAGEATGMAAKTTLRELRLRTEAARRRFEPGYRAPDQRRLPEGTLPKLTPSSFTPEREAIPFDPRTGQPRRRKPQGFGRTDNYIQHYAPVQLQPPTRRDACWEGYEQVGMKPKGKRMVPNCVPTQKKKAQADTEDGKKYTKVVTNPETGRKNKVRYGAKGYTIAPGTEKGDRYCQRSYGQMKMHKMNCAGPDKNSPLCLSRSKWRCTGKQSQ